MATVTAEPLAVIAESEDREVFFEIIDGQRVELPPTGAYETVLASRLCTRLDGFGSAQQLGQAATETLFDLRPAVNRNRRPDVAFVPFERWARGRRIPRGNAWVIVPGLAIEVISPNDLAEEILTKVLEYFREGVRLAWVVYPGQGMIHVYESPRSARILGRDDDLDGGSVLPGFRLPLADLFEEEEPESGTEPDAIASPTS